MNTSIIDKAFAELISRRAVHQVLGINSDQVRTMRYKLNNGISISTDIKLRWLQKSGWRQTDRTFSRSEVVAILKLYKKSSQAAKDLGFEYIIENYLKKVK
jgi:hypothetical protein